MEIISALKLAKENAPTVERVALIASMALGLPSAQQESAKNKIAKALSVNYNEGIVFGRW